MDISHDIAMLRLRQNTALANNVRRSAAAAQETEKYNKELRKASDGFEELFLHQLLQVMRQAGPKSHLVFGGRGEEIFQDMLDENYAKIITESKAFGLSDVIYNQNKK